MYGLKQVARSQITEHQGLGEQASKHQTRVIWPPATTQPVTMLENSSGVESCLSSLLLYPVDQDIDDLLVQLHFLLCSFRDKVSGKCFLQKEIHYEHFPGYKRCKPAHRPREKEQERDCTRQWQTLPFCSLFTFLCLSCSGHI